MQLVDSHCHLNALDLTSYNGDFAAMLAAARAHKISYILTPTTTMEEIPAVIQLVKYDPKLFATVGVHPTETQSSYPTFERLAEFAMQKKVIGIGEIGLDFACTTRAESYSYQSELFKLQLKVAAELQKPVVIHARNADRDLIEILENFPKHSLKGVLHCFTGEIATMKRALELGFYISVSGIVTFKNATAVRELARSVPLDRLLLETDAPYLAPVPYRGKPNEPAFIYHTALYLAELLKTPLETLAEITTNNFLTLYNL